MNRAETASEGQRQTTSQKLFAWTIGTSNGNRNGDGKDKLNIAHTHTRPWTPLLPLLCFSLSQPKSPAEACRNSRKSQTELLDSELLEPVLRVLSLRNFITAAILSLWNFIITVAIMACGSGESTGSSCPSGTSSGESTSESPGISCTPCLLAMVTNIVWNC